MTPPPYDPDLRRDTPLARKLAARIRRDGPIDLSDYMDACLNDADYGYYRTRTAIGRSGDFITAPEISQVFGELIGLWCAVVWQQMGAPHRVNLIELGAGRGTLMADALRATRGVPGFRAAASVHIVDTNPALIRAQRAALADCSAPVAWYEDLVSVPFGAPSIWIANEFLDIAPMQQWQRHDGSWTLRAIGLDESGRLAFVPAAKSWKTFTDSDLPLRPGGETRRDGDIFERQSRPSLQAALKRCSAGQPLTALFIDYGYTGAARIDTLQAVRAHACEHVLHSPGEADLSCQVDFDTFAHDFRKPPMEVDGPVTQSQFLGRIGVIERAVKLMGANPGQANALETGVARLLAPQGMGMSFKVIGIRSVSQPPLPGLSER